MSIQIIGKKCPRTHSPVSRSSSHHPCISVKQCQSFLKLSLYIPFLTKYFYSLCVVLTRTLRSGNPLLQWKFLEIGLEEDKNICQNSSPEGAIAARKTLPLNLAPSWGWNSKHTCKHCQIYIIFLLVIEFVNFDFDFEDGSERNKSYWIGW